MPHQPDRVEGAPRSAPGRAASTRAWLWLVGLQVVLGLLALLGVYALSGTWLNAVGAMLSIIGLTAAIGATIVKRREDPR